MKQERFERELRYQAMMNLCRTLREQGVFSDEDFTRAEQFLRKKYQPIFNAA